MKTKIYVKISLTIVLTFYFTLKCYNIIYAKSRLYDYYSEFINLNKKFITDSQLIYSKIQEKFIISPKNLLLSENEKQELVEFSENFLKENSSKINNLINNFDNLINSPLYFLTTTEIKLKNYSFTNQINASLSRDISKLILLISLYFMYSTKYEEALKLQILVWRLGQILVSGDGAPQNIIVAAVGVSIKNIALEHIQYLIVNHMKNLDLRLLEKLSFNIKKCVDEEIDLNYIMECEKYVILNMVKNQRFSPKVIKLIEEYYNELNEILNNYKNNPDYYEKKLEYHFKKIEYYAKDTYFNKIFSPYRTLAYKTLELAIPDLRKAPSNFLKSWYQSIGMAILFKVVTYIKTHKKIPKNIDEIEKICKFNLPCDYFNNKNKLNYRLVNQYYILYSNGLNYLDDSGYFRTDIILAIIPYQ